MKTTPILKAAKKEAKHVLLTMLAALVSVIALHTFVVPSDFSPSGIDGVGTILYEITGWNMGWFKIAINLPLLALAYVFLNKKYVLYVIFFTLLDSFGVILLEEINFFVYIPNGLGATELIGYRLLSAVVSGILLGICVGIMLKIGYSSGGVDIIACLAHKWKPHVNVERIISICAYSIVGISFFVYRDLTSILLSSVQIFVCERMISAILRRDRFAVEVKIITKHPEVIRDEILYKHKHSATIAKTTGLYSGEENFMVFSVMSIRDIPSLMNTMKKHPDAFVYFSDGMRVQGDFHFNEEDVGRRISAFE